MARGFAALEDVDLTVVVNVGDDQTLHGLHISPDLDTVVYTLAEMEGPMGWGRDGDTFGFNDELKRFGVDNEFQLGDKDLALKLYRTGRLGQEATLTTVTREVTKAFGLKTRVVPVTDDRLRTEIRIDDVGWIGFSEYFVTRGHRDSVAELRFSGAAQSSPGPGVIEAIADSDRVVIGPSNPPLSIWPILAVPGVTEAVRAHPRVVCVSPLVEGKPFKGPADSVLASLGLGSGNPAVARAYAGLIDTLVVNSADNADTETLQDLEVVAMDTLIQDRTAAAILASQVVAL